MNDARQRCSDQTAQQIDVATKERPLTRFSEMISDMHRIDGAWTTDISEEWLQGRALFGGLTAALCLEAAAREFPDLPPLRSAQFAMVAPSSGDVSIHAQLLRRGKSATFVSTSLFSESGLATRATLCFGAPRSSAFDYVRTTAHTVPPPDQCPLFERRATFRVHYDGALAAGNAPYSQAADPTFLVWTRLRDDGVPSSPASLVMIADSLPPSMVVMFKERPPLSTMTWAIDFLSDDLATEDGWWLMRVAADNAQYGYSAEQLTVWNSTGRPVLISRQTVALFI